MKYGSTRSEMVKYILMALKTLITTIIQNTLKREQGVTKKKQNKTKHTSPPFQIFLTVAKKNPYPQGLSSDRPRNAVN